MSNGKVPTTAEYKKMVEQEKKKDPVAFAKKYGGKQPKVQNKGGK